MDLERGIEERGGSGVRLKRGIEERGQSGRRRNLEFLPPTLDNRLGSDTLIEQKTTGQQIRPLGKEVDQMSYQIGSLGTLKDAKAALETSCMAAPGHGWDPSSQIETWVDGPVAASPTCKECVAQMKSRLQNRGLSDKQMVAALKRLGVSINEKKEYESSYLSEEDMIISGGKYTDWARGKGSQSREPKKLGDHIVYVAQMTSDMEEANNRLKEEQDRVTDMRMQAIDHPGYDLERLVREFPMPDMPFYAEKPQEA